MHRDGEVVNHARFQELAARAATGQVSSEEYAALVAHLEVCATCKEEYGDFEEIVHGQLLLLRSDMAPLSELSSHAIRPERLKERFFARAQAEGLPFAPSPPVRRPLATRLHLTLRNPAFAYSAAFLLLVMASFSTYQWRQASLASQARLKEVERLNRHSADLRQQFSAAANAQDSWVTEEISVAQSRNVELNALYDSLERRLKAALDDVRTLQAQMQELAQADHEKQSRLSADLEQARGSIGQMTTELDGLRKARSENVLMLQDRQARIDELQSQLKAQSESLDRVRRLLAADRDIRDLMGARNLHITDVYDVDSKGKTRQLFGRVFYTKEKSLIFYAFDLQSPQVTLAKQSFQAWGYKESAKQVTRSLGIFYLDDKNQNRWALKFDDPTVLAEIDAVFVTVEPPGGSSKPTGQKLLYAYLRGDANHP